MALPASPATPSKPIDLSSLASALAGLAIGQLPQYVGAIGTGVAIPIDKSGTNTQANSRSVHFIHDNATALQFVFPNFYIPPTGTGVETGSGAAMAITASVEVMGTGVRTQITFGGAAQGSVPNGGYLSSDMVTLATPIVLPASGKPVAIIVRSYQVAQGVLFCGTGTQGSTAIPAYNAPLGEAFELGTSLADKTMVGDATRSSATAATMYRPICIAGVTKKRSFGLVGDSLVAGKLDTCVGDTADVGTLARSLGRFAGYINVAIPSDRTSSYLNSNTNRTALLNAYCSDIINELGINDFVNGVLIANVETNILAINALFANKRIWQATILPYTTSTDGWATAANQSIFGQEPSRISHNTTVRAGIAGTYGYIDLARVIEDPANAGKWLSYGTATNGIVGDGVHPLPVGYLKIRESGEVSQLRMMQ